MREHKIFERIRAKHLDPTRFVYVSSRDVYNEQPTLLPINLITSSYYHSERGLDRWVRFDFSISHVYLTGIELQSTKNRDPYNWVLEGSNDSINFKVIYNNTNTLICTELVTSINGIKYCANNDYKNFTLPSPVIYNSFRIRNTGDSSNPGDYFLILNSVDFIGYFTDILFPTCKQKTQRRFYIITFILFLM